MVWFFYLSLKIAYQEAIEDFAGFVAVTDVFEGFSCVLASNVEENFFAASVENSTISGLVHKSDITWSDDRQQPQTPKKRI